MALRIGERLIPEKCITVEQLTDAVLATDLGMPEAIAKYYPPGTPQVSLRMH